MNAKTATEKFLGSAFVTVVELRAMEAKKNEANPAKNKGESHYNNYKVLVGDDSADVKHYAKRGSVAAPPALKFTKGQRAVVTGKFEDGEWGLSCMCDSIELLEG